MTPPSRHDSGEYSRARESEDDHAYQQRVHAARTVAGNARDVEDLQLLLSILGLDAADRCDGDTPWPGTPDPLSATPHPRRPVEDVGYP